MHQRPLIRVFRILQRVKGAHYPMLTFAAETIVKDHPKLAENIGFFAQPGTSAKRNGLTLWMPAGFIHPKYNCAPYRSQEIHCFYSITCGNCSNQFGIYANWPLLDQRRKVPWSSLEYCY